MKYFQDGGQFYDEQTGELVANYEALVQNDRDIRGGTNGTDSFPR